MIEKLTINDIIKLRKENKISQTKLAEYLSIEPAKISGVEKGKIIPTKKDLFELYNGIELMKLEIKNKTLNISKKRITKSFKKKFKIPKIIKSADEYHELLAKRNSLKDNEYRDSLSILYKKMISSKKEKPNGIALFSGCGGLTAGFEAAGFNIVGHVEIEPSANLIYESNFPHSKLLGTDVCNISEGDVNEWKKMFGDIDIIIGGPPCQGFSLAGNRNPNDARNQLYNQYAKIVNMVKPKVFVMENVFNMTTMKDTDEILFIDKIKERFYEYGYELNINYINAKDYGVPQSRERVIIIGTLIKDNKKFDFPKKNNKIITFKEATYDLTMLESAELSDDPLHWTISHPQHVIEWLKDVPEGHSAHENENPDLRPPSGFNTTYKRIRWNEPCSTISTNFSMISGCRNVHPESTRSLTIREAARAQSFPDEFAFIGKWGDIRKAIGNAVPPILAEHIAIAIKNQLI